MLPTMLLILFTITLISLFFSRYAAKTIVQPINALDMSNPLGNVTYDELAPLLTSMERQRREIVSRMSALSEKQREFTAVAENMREGLILLDTNDRMIAINGSAARTIVTDVEHVLGAHVLMLNRSVALQQALECVAWEGRISLLGCTRVSDVPIDFYRYVHRRGVTLVGAHNSTRPSMESSPGRRTEADDYRIFLKLVAAGRMQVRPIISDVVSPEKAPEVYARLADDPNAPLGVVFDWSQIRHT